MRALLFVLLLPFLVGWSFPWWVDDRAFIDFDELEQIQAKPSSGNAVEVRFTNGVLLNLPAGSRAETWRLGLLFSGTRRAEPWVRIDDSTLVHLGATLSGRDAGGTLTVLFRSGVLDTYSGAERDSILAKRRGLVRRFQQ